jgi:fumarylacetoacetate (FAA) hydrolase
VIIDLPDAVGHPAFPSTMEALVARHGGTTLDAARSALEHADVLEEYAVAGATLLPPIIPTMLREFAPEEVLAAAGTRPGRARRHQPEPLPTSTTGENRRRILGPDAQVPWQGRGRELRFGLEVACVAGRSGRDLSVRRAGAAIFGYTLMASWWAVPGGNGTRRPDTEAPPDRPFATALGPFIVTPDDVAPEPVPFRATVDGETWWVDEVDPSALPFAQLIADVSRTEDIGAGETYGSSSLGFGFRSDQPTRLPRGCAIELEADGFGTLSLRVPRRG